MTLRKCTVLALAALLLSLVACQAQMFQDKADAETESEYMEPICAYYTAIESSDFSALQQAMPAHALDSLGLDAGELSNTVNNFSKIYGVGYTVAVTENGSAQLDESQLADLTAYLKREYGTTATLTDGYLVESSVVFSGSTSSQTFTEGYVVYELGEQWYMDLLADASVASIRALYDNTAN